MMKKNNKKIRPKTDTKHDYEAPENPEAVE
jgi:hypothetical protein